MSVHNPTLPFPPIPPEFDDFVVGENRQVLSTIRAVSSATTHARSQVVYVWGGDACGKTHLLRVASEAMRQNGGSGFYVPRGESIPQPMHGLLAVDDIQHLTESQRLLLFDWQNKAAPPHSPYRILAAGNAPPPHLPLGAEIIARLNAGLVFRLRELAESEKREALARYAKRRGFDLPSTVSHLLLTRLPRDMSNLIAALADLDKFLLMQQKNLTPFLARAWLRQKLPLAATSTPSTVQATLNPAAPHAFSASMPHRQEGMENFLHSSKSKTH